MRGGFDCVHHQISDGANFADEPQNLESLVLESMRHRIRALGGVVNVAQPAEGGVVVEVSTPIANVITPAPGAASRN
jgi:signal transduction histidine kinase